jgi:hypothetical protein
MAEVAKPLSVTRIPVEGACPECGAKALQRYEALSAGGWFQVVKCQECLASAERTPWNRLGSVRRNQADAVIASGGSRR